MLLFGAGFRFLVLLFCIVCICAFFMFLWADFYYALALDFAVSLALYFLCVDYAG